MSEKRFLGWEPVEVTEYEYDDQGRLVRAITTREPEWDDMERDKRLGWDLYQSEICSCGFHRSLTEDDANRFKVSVQRCPVCGDLDRWERIQGAEDKQELEALGKEPQPERTLDRDGRRNVVALVEASS